MSLLYLHVAELELAHGFPEPGGGALLKVLLRRRERGRISQVVVAAHEHNVLEHAAHSLVLRAHLFRERECAVVVERHVTFGHLFRKRRDGRRERKGGRLRPAKGERREGQSSKNYTVRHGNQSTMIQRPQIYKRAARGGQKGAQNPEILIQGGIRVSPHILQTN